MWVGVILFFTYLMSKIVGPYFSESWDYDFLVTKMGIIHLSYYRAAFLIHISSSLIVIFTGSLLFLTVRGPLWWRMHRLFGRLYVGLVLLLAAPSGLIMGYYANGGILGQINFILLSILWWWFTFEGLRTIRQGNVPAHKKWMVRSYALTLSAITLRFLQMMVPMSWYVDPDFVYVVVSWSSWILNLGVGQIVNSDYDWRHVFLSQRVAA